LELSVSRLQLGEGNRVETRLLPFQVFDGASRVTIEARSKEDAAYLCIDMGWELIGACDD